MKTSLLGLVVPTRDIETAQTVIVAISDIYTTINNQLLEILAKINKR